MEGTYRSTTCTFYVTQMDHNDYFMINSCGITIIL